MTLFISLDMTQLHPGVHIGCKRRWFNQRPRHRVHGMQSCLMYVAGILFLSLYQISLASTSSSLWLQTPATWGLRRSFRRSGGLELRTEVNKVEVIFTNLKSCVESEAASKATLRVLRHLLFLHFYIPRNSNIAGLLHVKALWHHFWFILWGSSPNESKWKCYS